MRKLGVMFIALVLPQLAIAYSQVVQDTGNTVPAYRYIPAKRWAKPRTLSKHPTLQVLTTPSKNTFTQGKVRKHKLTVFHAMLPAFFIIGDDSVSKQWLAANARVLQRLHAVGIIAHLAPSYSLRQLQAETALPLTAANLNGLAKVIGTSHYPVLIAKGWVEQ